MHIIHSAVVKLTLYYIAVIMLLSLSFSLILYGIYSSELSRGFRRPPDIFQSQLNPDRYEDFRNARIDEATNDLRNSLFIFNIVTLILGAVVGTAWRVEHYSLIEDAFDAQSRFTADASQ